MIVSVKEAIHVILEEKSFLNRVGGLQYDLSFTYNTVLLYRPWMLSSIVSKKNNCPQMALCNLNSCNRIEHRMGLQW